MTSVLAADVRVGDKVLIAVLERFVTVTAVGPTGSKKFGSDDVPMLRLALGPDARPAKAVELAADQTIEVEAT